MFQFKGHCKGPSSRRGWKTNTHAHKHTRSFSCQRLWHRSRWHQWANVRDKREASVDDWKSHRIRAQAAFYDMYSGERDWLKQVSWPLALHCSTDVRVLFNTAVVSNYCVSFKLLSSTFCVPSHVISPSMKWNNQFLVLILSVFSLSPPASR